MPSKISIPSRSGSRSHKSKSISSLNQTMMRTSLGLLALAPLTWLTMNLRSFVYLRGRNRTRQHSNTLLELFLKIWPLARYLTKKWQITSRILSHFSSKTRWAQMSTFSSTTSVLNSMRVSSAIRASDRQLLALDTHASSAPISTCAQAVNLRQTTSMPCLRFGDLVKKAPRRRSCNFPSSSCNPCKDAPKPAVSRQLERKKLPLVLKSRRRSLLWEICLALAWLWRRTTSGKGPEKHRCTWICPLERPCLVGMATRWTTWSWLWERCLVPASHSSRIASGKGMEKLRCTWICPMGQPCLA